MSDAQQESTRGRPKGNEKSPFDKLVYALSIAALSALAAVAVLLIWNSAERNRQVDLAYVQAIEDMYSGVDVEERLDEGQVRLTSRSAEDGRDHCFGPEEYRVVADSVESPDALLCFDRDRYREIVEFVESGGGEIIGRAVEEDTLAVVFTGDGPFGVSCAVPTPNDTGLHCAV